MFQAAVDGLRGPVRGAGPVEVGQDVTGPLGEGVRPGGGPRPAPRDTVGEGGDEFPIRFLPCLGSVSR